MGQALLFSPDAFPFPVETGARVVFVGGIRKELIPERLPGGVRGLTIADFVDLDHNSEKANDESEIYWVIIPQKFLGFCGQTLGLELLLRDWPNFKLLTGPEEYTRKVAVDLFVSGGIHVLYQSVASDNY
jgi:hypothetical protein